MALEKVGVDLLDRHGVALGLGDGDRNGRHHIGRPRREQHKLVEPLYQLDKEGKLSPDQPQGAAGRAFFERQFITGAQMLGDLWFTAWREAPPDNFLKSALARRRLAAGGPSS